MTPEQQAAIDDAVAGKSIAIDAVAGSGKTTTLVGISKQRSGLFLAFNASVKKELEKRVNGTCMTLNGLGHRLWSKSVGRLTLDNDKIFRIAKSRGLTHEQSYEAKRVIESARVSSAAPTSLDLFQSLVEDNDYSPDIIPHLPHIFSVSIAEARNGIIDFTDQLYMPVKFPCPKLPNPVVIVDEAQDLNPLQHSLLNKVYSKQMIIAGDPHQAIYDFRGASSNSMGELSTLFNLAPRQLTVSFRCATSIIEQAQLYVPHIRPRDNAPRGTVALAHLPSTFSPNTAVLCRYNAPLLRLAFKLLTSFTPFTYLGKDIVERLINLVKKFKTSSIDDLNTQMEEWWENKMSNGKNWADDIYKSYTAAVEVTNATTADELYRRLRELSTASGGVTLSTIHKAKGLEWDSVYIIDRIPRDEPNHAYVAITRAINNLYYVVD